MKKLFLVTCLFSLSALQPLLACSPPLPVVHQTDVLNKGLSSEAFRQALGEQMSANPNLMIKSIDFEGGRGLKVHLNNDCAIKLGLRYLPPTHPGFCPRFDRVEAETSCE